ncbi:hypothetical protein [Nocardia farcinica]|uniref:hypothetical protein n=1 Tax=Nocardia farcinica TaxID=37329 RepID=UPI002457ECC5|nr:hypothetical protein [Nocardia farcinica]
MTNPGFFNHYDDSDEFWDDEPIVRKHPAVSSKPSSMPPPRSYSPREPAPPWEPTHHVAPVDQRETPKVGSSFVSMELDRGLLPSSVRFAPSWRRYVAPNDVGDELMAAYRGAVVERLNFLYSSSAGRLPAPHEVSDSAVPDRRTVLMVLLETETWDQYCEVSSSMVGGGRYTVSGRIEVGSGHPVTAVADRRYLRSIAVWSDWAAAVHPDDLGDEILTCAERIRSMRPRFSVRYDYSRYSDADLEYHLDRHRLRLLEERVK